MYKVKKCTSPFKSVREWNEHHRLQHLDKTYKCMKCGKISPTPVSFRDHSYFYRVKKFTCNRCNKNFINISHLNLHWHIHCWHQLYSCFAPKCRRKYKWPQDLLWHIKVHLAKVYKCTQCEYSNKQKRLLSQHINIHTPDLKFACRGCLLWFRHSVQRYQQENEHDHAPLA